VVFVKSTAEVKEFLRAFENKVPSERAKIRLVSNRVRFASIYSVNIMLSILH